MSPADRPFSAATSKFAYAQAFTAAPVSHRVPRAHSVKRRPRLALRRRGI